MHPFARGDRDTKRCSVQECYLQQLIVPCKLNLQELFIESRHTNRELHKGPGRLRGVPCWFGGVVWVRVEFGLVKF